MTMLHNFAQTWAARFLGDLASSRAAADPEPPTKEIPVTEMLFATAPSSTAVTVEHTFEAAHRLPRIPGKCRSIHGHSWRVSVTVRVPDASEFVVQFGKLKAGLREWIDEYLDHGALLGQDDALLDAILADGGKVFVFPTWPTVENVARLLAGVASQVLADLPAEDVARGARVTEVTVQETAVNRATWRAAW